MPVDAACPVWQNGTPQSMQRAPCSLQRRLGRWSWNSFQSRTRAFGIAPRRLVRANSMKPVGLPIVVSLHPYLPPRRAASFAFSSNAAISASSSDSPAARIFACASSTRR